MHFNKRYFGSKQRITDGNAGMGECRRVNDNEVGFCELSVVDEVDNFMFGIALLAAQLVSQLCGLLFKHSTNISQGLVSIEAGFA